MRCRIVAVIAVALLPAFAVAQAYPDKPVRMIVAVPAGGTPDVVARMVQPGLSSLLGQQVVIDNRGGAGGLIGTELAAKAAPDGYTLFFSAPGPLTVVPHLQKQVGYDTQKDFAPIGLIATGPFVLLAHPSVPVETVGGLIALAKAEPGKLRYASAGNGSSNHLSTELFKNMAGVNITHVPYKGAPQGVTDVIGGHVHLTMISIPTALPQVKAGRLRLLGISSAKRSPLLPEVATISEAGVPGYEWSTWLGLLAPAKTSRQIVAHLNGTLVKVVRAPGLKSQFEVLGYEVVGSSPEEFAAFISADWAKNARAVKFSGAKID